MGLFPDTSMESEFENTTHYRHQFERFSGSFALISPSDDADHAVVFVHGWGGHPFHTWNQFHSLIDVSGPCHEFYQKCDLYFFRYESQGEWINASTDRLLNFLDQLVLEQQAFHFVEDVEPMLGQFPELAHDDLTYSVLPAPRVYSRIVLVGHSEGGVVVRNAVLKRFKSTKYRLTKPLVRKQLMNSRLHLFAPAIAGFRPAGFLGILMKFPGIGQILQAFLNNSAGYQDLASDSELLKVLRSETERAASKNPSSALRADILWGYRDRVVHPTKYEDDTEEFVDKDHVSVCKPMDEFLLPIEFIARSYVRSGETITVESES